jgi:hypothetical protein
MPRVTLPLSASGDAPEQRINRRAEEGASLSGFDAQLNRVETMEAGKRARYAA